MNSSISVRSWFASAVIATAALCTSPALAQQDSGWLWGGSETPGGSGRESVRFSPQFSPGQVIVSFGDRRLYLVTRPGEALSYPIAIPREQSRWQGLTSVTMKRENPSWTPTATMIAENPRLPRWVPGGHPMNPLGVRALYLGSSTYRIHGTDAPWTIGSAVSKGCIRMFNQDVVDLYPRVHVGAKVTVTWQTYSGSAVAMAPQSYADQPGQRRHAQTAGEPRQEREVRRPYTRAAANYVPSSTRKRVATTQQAESASEQGATIEEAPPRRKYAVARKITAKKVVPRVSSAETSQE